MIHFRFILREIRSSGKQAILFICCVALSLLTLVSLGGFSSSVRYSMLQDARTLHAADIIIHSHYPFSTDLVDTINELAEEGETDATLVHRFYSMVRNPQAQRAILCQLKVVESGYPFYGRVELASGEDFSEVLGSGRIIVEQSVLDRLGAAIGDKLQIGAARLTIVDVVTAEPDRPVSFFSFGPRIFVAAADLDRLDLLEKGSRIQFEYLLKVHDPDRLERLAGRLSQVASDRRERVRTFRTAESGVKRFFDNFLFFLNLIGIFTLLLAGIGIRTTLQTLLRESRYTIAIMKTVGATSRFITSQYIILIMVLGLAGITAGLGASFLLQLFFPLLFAGILPAQVEPAIAWDVVFEGLALGGMVVLLFTFPPLARIRILKPSIIFRKEEPKTAGRLSYYAGTGLITLFFSGLAVWQLEDVRTGLLFVLGLAGLTGLAAVFSQLLLFILKKLSPGSLTLRQALRGLFRPNNATRSIIITLSCSLSVIFSIVFIEDNLQATFVQSFPPDLPNAYFLDIQPEQQEEFVRILGQEPEFYPVIRARLFSINGQPVSERQQEPRRGRDSLTREFNLTYRDFLLDDEKMAEGDSLFARMKEFSQSADEIPVSVLDTVAELGDITLGDLLLFKIQGIPVKARVTSLRTRTASKVRPFFYFVFPPDALRDAPRTMFSAAKIDPGRLAEIQNTLTARLPNVSVIDIGRTIEVLADIMHKLSSIITFFTSFSLLAGILIIISSIFATRLARTREAVYFKILGARSGFVLRVFLQENLAVALISALLALLFAHTGSWLICTRIFVIPYEAAPLKTLFMIGATVLLVVGIGLAASLAVLRYRPALFLRNEKELNS